MPDEEEPKRKLRPHHPRKVRVVDLELRPVSRVHPKCIFKGEPKGGPCFWRMPRSDRCRKRLEKGANYQLTAEGYCPSWKLRPVKRDIKDSEPYVPPVQEGVKA